MIIPIKQIITENEFFDQAQNSVDNYNNSINAYNDLQNRGLSTMERQAMLKGINNLTGSNYTTHENLDPNDTFDKIQMNAGRLAYPDSGLIKDYASYEKDRHFENEVEKHIDDNSRLSLDNEFLQNDLASKTRAYDSQTKAYEALKSHHALLGNRLHDANRRDAIISLGATAAGIGGGAYLLHNHMKNRRPQ